MLAIVGALKSPAQHLWFLDTLVSIHVSASTGTDGISLIEHYAPYADSPPLHLHVNEDEVFYVLEGELRMQTERTPNISAQARACLLPKAYRIPIASNLGKGRAGSP